MFYMQEIQSSYTSILGLVLSAFKLLSLSYLLEHIACFRKISNSFPKDFDVVNCSIQGHLSGQHESTKHEEKFIQTAGSKS